MQDALDVAVVGCGYWGPNLIRNFDSISGCRLKWICDMDTSRLAHMKDLYPAVSVTTDFDDIINDEEISAVAVATPVFLHHELGKRSLLAGKHTFIEKPMAASVGECMELVRLANKQQLTLMVGHTFVYGAAVRKVKEIVDSGELGDMLYISAQRLNLGLFQPDINVVWDLAPHDISIILHLLGKTPVAVSGQGQAHYLDNIEDVATATLHFDNSEIAFLHQSWLDPCKVRKMTLVGSKKMLVYDDVDNDEKIKIFDKRFETPPHYDTFAEFHFSYRCGDIHIPHINECEPLRAECEHFLECIRRCRQPQTPGSAGLAIVAIIEAICESMRTGGRQIELREDGHAGERNERAPRIETKRLADVV